MLDGKYKIIIFYFLFFFFFQYYNFVLTYIFIFFITNLLIYRVDNANKEICKPGYYEDNTPIECPDSIVLGTTQVWIKTIIIIIIFYTNH